MDGKFIGFLDRIFVITLQYCVIVKLIIKTPGSLFSIVMTEPDSPPSITVFFIVNYNYY